MEIVSDPDMRSPEEAYQYLVALKSIIEYLDVSDCDMEEGKFRCDANVSVRPVGQKELGTKAEVKNMNTLKGVREALEYEIKRQIEAVSAGEKIVQETRLWNAGERKTYPMRSKEEAHDYRYFPEPDLVPMELSKEFIDTVCSDMPELPVARRERFKQQWELSDYDAGVLTADKALRVMKRRWKNADVYLFFNEGAQASDRAVTLISKGRAAEAWDPQTGTVAAVQSTRGGGNLTVPLKLQPYETRVIVVR